MPGQTSVTNLNWRGTPAVWLDLEDSEEFAYIGRGSAYGNPFGHLPSVFGVIRVDSREDAVQAYRLWLTTDLEVPGWRKPTHEQIEALRGKVLGCFCKPHACHGDVLIELLGER